MTMQDFGFTLLNTDGRARRGVVHTGRGDIQTPAFMPVGTVGTVKGIYLDQVKDAGADIILGNTYHLMLRPGAERVNRLGGLHHFIQWVAPILTDSGGFQVMSLAGLRELDEAGVTFKSHIDGSTYHMSPERSIEIQTLLGSDIQMQLDECVALPASRDEMQSAMELSLRWAERCKTAFGDQRGKAMYGIVQGGDDVGLREQSAAALKALDLRGYSIGGLAVGEPQDVMLAMLDVVCPILPAEKPRYLMGVGTPQDLLRSVARGVDQFDCVMPTRSGRHGLAFTRRGRVNLKNARHAEDQRPLDEAMPCEASTRYSRAYLHHLIRANEMLGQMLLSWHNTVYYQWLMRQMREAIAQKRFEVFAEETEAMWQAGDIAPV
ncbi:MAG: tRNA guanosine(34) transglycosylase Tgt [Pseudomonadota bacterium]